nr:immunoglobulin heavy chain junction region [Macaca mulatta]MOW78076.1 immunoglobulin heavy chain junction region [Macaca mulatta]MOW80016.1 immunoglobulin heavy chain junction region [Macaca mulatta]MOW80074.1 immunoglobulin heavy chain junction region [Macaca mulatta]MOW80201.1 immunoglobulin heavy chain junction region [Macaca mulatta]
CARVIGFGSSYGDYW